jgi:hypothetical protein
MILDCCATGMAKGLSGLHFVKILRLVQVLHFVKILRFARDDKAGNYMLAWPV